MLSSALSLIANPLNPFGNASYGGTLTVLILKRIHHLTELLAHLATNVLGHITHAPWP